MSDFEWTDEDTAAAITEALPDSHPSRFVDVIRCGAQLNDPRWTLMAPFFVTPESNLSWGDDFGVLTKYMQGDFLISTTPMWAIGAPDIAYVRFVAPGGPWIVPDLTKVDPVGVATLVWRDDLDAPYGDTYWRLHGVGDAVPPEFAPRSPAPVDPRPLIR